MLNKKQKSDDIRLINKEKTKMNVLEDAQKWIDYRFNNIDLLKQAFTRSSYSIEQDCESNEVLEFIGDEVLDYFVVKMLIEQYGFMKGNSKYFNEYDDSNEFYTSPYRKEADLTQLKEELVSNENLADIIEDKGFARYLRLSKSDRYNDVEDNVKAKADLFEAILGAEAIDSNWNPIKLQRSIERMLDINDFFDYLKEKEEEPTIELTPENAINTLKELYEHKYCSEPKYIISDEPYIDDAGILWSCKCTVKSWRISITEYGVSKKDAKKHAAYQVLLKYLNECEEENDNEIHYENVERRL